ncbi:MAG: hypothetical protein NWF04_07945 [Candidatus Bathyarchaeota archaeon]|nr:hypothetical protein [Candidatus Bathyarchaeota archaeon]
MIKIRLDVDYPYPSRIQSFLFTALNTQVDKNYLKNSKIIAKMVNESKQDVKAYWFFTPQTIPDNKTFKLLDPKKHEIALHVATDPYGEWKTLEKATGRQVKYYTVHGTARKIARIMWRRKIWEAKAPIPKNFPLKSFYDFPTLPLDWLCHRDPTDLAVKIAKEKIAKNTVIHIHPEWLFQSGTFNPRGPYYETLKILLDVDGELDGLAVHRRVFAKVAQYQEEKEYLKDYAPSEKFLGKLTDRDADIFTFIERTWCCPITNPPSNWLKTKDNIALLQVPPYEKWLSNVGKKTRNMIRKANKNGVTTQTVQPTKELAQGIWQIYNETPIRQGRAFSHYGISLEAVENQVIKTQNSTFIGAFFEEQLVGFVQLVHGDQIMVMAQILSLQKFWDKAVNNALIAKAVEVCATTGEKWLMYGRMGNHPSLDTFKENNGFAKCNLTRYYVPLTRKGHITAKLGLHKKPKDALPESLKGAFIPLFNWISRTKTKIKT